MGPHYASIKEEVADPEHRDGLAALLDDDEHDRAVREQSQNRPASEPESE
jgi:hypothetical protein